MANFDPTLARLQLEICRYTYAASFNDPGSQLDKQNALDWINQAGAPTALVLLDDGKKPSTSVACVAAYPDKNIVAYMGTKTNFKTLPDAIASIKDWTENLEALLMPFKLTAEQLGTDHPDKDNLGGRVHRGFLEELAKIQAKVLQELEQHGGKGRPLYVTGHSQGGAEAALATRAFLAGGYAVAASYTFAAPRPGDKAFADSIPATLPFHRLEFGDDIVPHVPPRALSKQVQMVVAGLSKIPFLPDSVKSLFDLMKKASEKTSFVGAGRLCYGNNSTKTLRVDLSAEEEDKLFNGRLTSLVFHPGNWAEHHHLAGTMDEVSKGLKGNYTALVSQFTVSS